MEDLIKESMFAAEEEFYNTPFYFSYSSLNKLLWNPSVFYSIYIMKIKPETIDMQSLIKGKLIHLFLLEPDKFEDNYIIIEKNLPADNIKNIIDTLYSKHKVYNEQGILKFELEEYQDEILEILKEINLYQSYKTDKQRIDKIITEDTLSYWSFLFKKENKQLIDQETYNYCNTVANNLLKDENFVELIGLNKSNVYNEHNLEYFLKNYEFGLKGVIDNIVVDHDNKTVTINDIKTTSKELKDFSDSIEYYNYWMQAAIYIILVSFNFKEINELNYKINFNFVVIDSYGMYYTFKVSDATLENWFKRFNEESLKAASYHFNNRKYLLPYKFCTNQVVL